MSPEKRVLIVEDDDFNRMFMKELLGTLATAVTVDEAASATDAMTAVENAAPDLVILDIQLRDGSGIAVAQRLKADAATQAIPIIAVTALAMAGDEQRIREAGCDDYVAKPIAVAPFVAKVSDFLKL